MALGTFAFRLLPLSVLTRLQLPTWARDWLGLVPGAVLAASLAQALLVHEGAVAITWRNTHLLAALPTALVAWRTRNMIATMAVGMLSFALLGKLFGL
jgi:branched-subunit amino acid transport protein